MPAIAILPFLAFFLGTSLPSIVFRVFSLLGIGVVTYQGAQTLLQAGVDLFLQQIDELPSTAVDILGYVGLDEGISMVISAYGIKLTLVTARRFLGVRS